VLGDLNDFQFFWSLTRHGSAHPHHRQPDGPIFAPGTAVFELIKAPENERYSFNFGGNAQALDHILVSNNRSTARSSISCTSIRVHRPALRSRSFGVVVVMSRSAAIATAGNDVLTRPRTRRSLARGSLAGNDTINGLGGDDRLPRAAAMTSSMAGRCAAAIVVYWGAEATTRSPQGGSFVTDNRTGASTASIPSRTLKGLIATDSHSRRITDTTYPVLTAAPADNATAVAAGNNIVLTFNEAVAAGSAETSSSATVRETRAPSRSAMPRSHDFRQHRHHQSDRRSGGRGRL
jgi:hypothetical protein